MKITIHSRQNGWVTGSIDGIRYEAKVFSKPSRFGIQGGPVSKLWIEGRVNYDRGWDSGEDKPELWSPLVSALTKFSESENFGNVAAEQTPMQAYAARLRKIADVMDNASDAQIDKRFHEDVLAPLETTHDELQAMWFSWRHANGMKP